VGDAGCIGGRTSFRLQPARRETAARVVHFSVLGVCRETIARGYAPRTPRSSYAEPMLPKTVLWDKVLAIAPGQQTGNRDAPNARNNAWDTPLRIHPGMSGGHAHSTGCRRRPGSCGGPAPANHMGSQPEMGDLNSSLMNYELHIKPGSGIWRTLPSEARPGQSGPLLQIENIIICKSERTNGTQGGQESAQLPIQPSYEQG
jgi:hypothetical protein